MRLHLNIILLLWYIILGIVIVKWINAGDWSSRPSLLTKSDDGCHFELMWYTASACAVGHQYGDNCQVNYPAMGLYLLLLFILWVRWSTPDGVHLVLNIQQHFTSNRFELKDYIRSLSRLHLALSMLKLCVPIDLAIFVFCEVSSHLQPKH